jgi:hypothetical protein
VGPGAGDEAVDPLIPLRDPRLLAHLVPLLDRWEALSSEDQALLLGIAEFVAVRQHRRDGSR